MRKAWSPLRALLAALLLTAVAMIVYTLGDPALRAWVVMGTNVAVVIAAAMRVRGASGLARASYVLLVTGFTFLVGVNAMWVMTASWGLAGSAPPLLHDLTLGAAYAALLAAAFLAIAPTIRLNSGGVIDAATLAIAVATVLWQALLAPSLHEGNATSTQRLYAFAITIFLSGTAGIILGVFANGTTGPSARPVLAYYAFAVLVAATANALDAAFIDPSTGLGPPAVDSLWILCYTASFAAIAHPAGREVFSVRQGSTTRLSSRRLTMLGVALVAAPAVAVAQALSGRYTEWLTCALAHVVVIVLVLLRVGQLAQAHRNAEARLQVLADHDVLTGLPNRRSVDRHLKELVERVRVGEAPGVVVCFIDLDGFKMVNDTRGHAAGDELLIQVATRLGTSFRSHQHDMVGRLGGDEFILIAECEPQISQLSLVGRLEDAFRRPFELSDGPATISASIGAAASTLHDPHSEDGLLTLADHAMYEHKRGKQAALVD